MLVLFASFHAFFYMVDGGINGFNGSYAMAALVMFGFFQMMLGLLQGFKRSLHVWLVVIIVSCKRRYWRTQETQKVIPRVLTCQPSRPLPKGQYLLSNALPLRNMHLR